MLFINRIKVRSRELALRKVTGSGTMQLLTLLLCEFLIILLLSLFIGGLLTELLFPVFTNCRKLKLREAIRGRDGAVRDWVNHSFGNFRFRPRPLFYETEHF